MPLSMLQSDAIRNAIRMTIYALGWRPSLLGRRPMPLGMLPSDAICIAICMTLCIRLEAIAIRLEAIVFSYAAK